MKKLLLLATILFILVSVTTACSIAKKDAQINDELDLSKVSFKMEINDAHMNKDFGMYGEVENESAIVLYGNVERGKINENSQVLFVDENGKVLHMDKVFKIEIILESSGSSVSIKRQNFAEKGEYIAVYFKAGNFSDDVQYSISSDNLELIRKSQFAVLE